MVRLPTTGAALNRPGRVPSVRTPGGSDRHDDTVARHGQSQSGCDSSESCSRAHCDDSSRQGDWVVDAQATSRPQELGTPPALQTNARCRLKGGTETEHARLPETSRLRDTRSDSPWRLRRRCRCLGLTTALTTSRREKPDLPLVATRCPVALTCGLTWKNELECIGGQQLETTHYRPGGQGVAGSNPVSPTQFHQVRGTFLLEHESAPMTSPPTSSSVTSRARPEPAVGHRHHQTLPSLVGCSRFLGLHPAGP